MDKNFERELPRGYKLATCLDIRSDSKSALKVTLLSLVFAIPGCIFIALTLIFKSDEISKAYDRSPIAFLMIVLLGYILYIILHELEHGRVYKKLTGEKLTFGINPLCAFCGVPNVFTYRKTALKAVQAPLILYSVIFTVLIFATLFVFPLLSFGISIIFAFHLSGCSGDIYVMWLLTRKYTEDTVLMNDTGPTMSIFVYDESITEHEERLAREHFERVTKKEPSEEKRRKNEKDAKIVSIVSIVLASIGLILHTLAFIGNRTYIKFTVDEPELYKYPSLWIALACIGIIVFCSLTVKKHRLLKVVIAACIIIWGIPILIISAMFPSGSGLAYTNDIENYGIYNYYDDEWMPALFPEEITEDMTPVYYSYYHSMMFDGVAEIYLEVKMTDDAYADLKSQYEGQLVGCWYDTDCVEYAKADKFFVYKDEGYCDGPDIKKIIFNDKENIVIFEYLYGIDPMYFENIYYFERFNIDGREYSNYLEALHESN